MCPAGPVRAPAAPAALHAAASTIRRGVTVSGRTAACWRAGGPRQRVHRDGIPVYVHASKHVNPGRGCTCIYMYLYMYIYMYTYSICIYMCVYTHVYVCVCTYRHRHHIYCPTQPPNPSPMVPSTLNPLNPLHPLNHHHQAGRQGELPKGSVRLGASSSGATQYVEPKPCIELNNTEAALADRWGVGGARARWCGACLGKAAAGLRACAVTRCLPHVGPAAQRLPVAYRRMLRTANKAHHAMPCIAHSHTASAPCPSLPAPLQ